MVDVKIFKADEKIVCVECIGHSGYAEAGEDIVCAGVSSIVQTAVLGLFSVAKVNAGYETDEKKGYLKVSLSNDISSEAMHDAQVILKTMLCGISDLRESYSDFINLEVIENVY